MRRYLYFSRSSITFHSRCSIYCISAEMKPAGLITMSVDCISMIRWISLTCQWILPGIPFPCNSSKHRPCIHTNLFWKYQNSKPHISSAWNFIHEYLEKKPIAQQIWISLSLEPAVVTAPANFQHISKENYITNKPYYKFLNMGSILISDCTQQWQHAQANCICPSSSIRIGLILN